VKLKLNAGATKAQKLKVTVPATGLSPGTYTLALAIDSTAVVPEKREDNNVVTSESPVIVTELAGG
jgi:hypothetical protein